MMKLKNNINPKELIRRINLKKVILPNTPYAFIFWLLNKLIQAYRITGGNNPFDKIIAYSNSVNIVFAGLTDMGYHCTRHTFATRALEIGVDPKTLSEILGHSSVGITLNLYAHSLEEHKKKEI